MSSRLLKGHAAAFLAADHHRCILAADHHRCILAADHHRCLVLLHVDVVPEVLALVTHARMAPKVMVTGPLGAGRDNRNVFEPWTLSSSARQRSGYDQVRHLGRNSRPGSSRSW